MPASSSDCVFTEAAVMPLSFTTPNVGGARTTNLVTGVVGTVFFNMEALPLSGGDRIQHLKIFGYNGNLTSDSIYNAKFWIRNSLDALLVDGQLILVSNNANDNATKKVRVMGYDSLGVAVQEEVALNGLTPVSTTTIWSEIHRIELRLVSSGALTNALGSITAQNASGPTTLGIIPVGKNSATAEMDIGMENSLNGSQTIATTAVAPVGVSFFRPRVATTALLAPSGGTIPAGSGAPLWCRWSLRELARPSLNCQEVLVFSGSAA